MHTVLSAFDSGEAARRAADRLVAAGFPREDVHVRGGESGDEEDDRVTRQAIASPEREIAVGPRALAAVDHFWDHLLGRGEHAQHARTYAEAVRRGGTVVVVDAAGEPDAERAAALLQECGAYDLAERVEQWRADGWSEVAAGQQQLPGGGTLRWRSAHVVHRPGETPLRELMDPRRDE